MSLKIEQRLDNHFFTEIKPRLYTTGAYLVPMEIVALSGLLINSMMIHIKRMCSVPQKSMRLKKMGCLKHE